MKSCFQTVIKGLEENAKVQSSVLLFYVIFKLNQISEQYEDISYHSYADDTQLYLSFKLSATSKLSLLKQCLSDPEKWMAKNVPQLNSDKTENILFDEDNIAAEVKGVFFMIHYVKRTISFVCLFMSCHLLFTSSTSLCVAATALILSVLAT